MRSGQAGAVEEETSKSGSALVGDAVLALWTEGSGELVLRSVEKAGKDIFPEKCGSFGARDIVNRNSTWIYCCSR